MRIPSIPIVARIPEYAAPGWIAYCTKRRLTQSEAIRRGIAALIESDDTATNEELVVSAQILEAFPEYALRSEGKYTRRKIRFFGSFEDMEEHQRIVRGETPFSPSP